MIEYEFRPEQGYVLASCNDPFSLSDLLSGEQDLASRDDYDPELSRVFDLRQIADLSLNPAELVSMVKGTRELPLSQQSKVALVATAAGSVSLLNLFVSHFNEQPMQVFRDLDAALAWMAHAVIEESASDSIKLIRLRGPLGIDDILSIQMNWYESEEFNPSLPALWDLRDTTPATSVDELQEKARYVAQTSGAAERTGRAAILVNSHLMGMMVEKMLGSDWRSSTRLVRSWQEAMDWLNTGDGNQ